MNFCLTAWGGNAKTNETTKINRVLKYASKMLFNVKRDTVAELYKQLCNTKIVKIYKDENHILNKQLQISKRSGRLLHCKTRTTRHHQSFLPFAVRNFEAKNLFV